MPVPAAGLEDCRSEGAERELGNREYYYCCEAGQRQRKRDGGQR